MTFLEWLLRYTGDDRDINELADDVADGWFINGSTFLDPRTALDLYRSARDFGPATDDVNAVAHAVLTYATERAKVAA
jgi:hypothetical protein